MTVECLTLNVIPIFLLPRTKEHFTIVDGKNIKAWKWRRRLWNAVFCLWDGSLLTLAHMHPQNKDMKVRGNWWGGKRVISIRGGIEEDKRDKCGCNRLYTQIKLKGKKKGALEMAHLVSFLSHKKEYLSLEAQNSHKKLGIEVHYYKLSTRL